MSTAATRRPLFGGALSCELPHGYLDASDVRPVPDHQEVFTAPHAADGRLVVFELLDALLDAPQLIDAAAEHFDELAHRNGATASTVHACRPLPPATAPTAAVADARAAADAADAADAPAAAAAAAVELSGSQRLPSGTQLHVALVLWRLAAQSTDVLLSVCRPRCPEATTADPLLVRALHASLRIHDWSLFDG